MIFVTVGTLRGYDRVVKKMDEIAKGIDEKVVMQIGHTAYRPVHAEYFEFTDDARILQLNRDARVVVSHAGIGSILTALVQRTPIIIVPRQKKYNEHWDDHQLEIAEAMKDSENVKVVYDENDLGRYLKMDLKYTDIYSNNNELVKRISECVNNI